MDKQKKEQFYNNIFKAGAVEFGQRKNRKEETALMIDWAYKNGQILEIGSNLGYFTGQLAKETRSHVVGIDTSSSRFVHWFAKIRNRKRSVSIVQCENFKTIDDRKTGLPFAEK